MGLTFSNCTLEESVISSSSTDPATTSSPTSSSNYHHEEETVHHQNSTTLLTPSPPSRQRRVGTVRASFSPRRAFLILLNTMTMNTRSGYFRHYTKQKGILYGAAIVYVISCCLISIFEPFLVDCQEEAVLSDFENPGYAFTQGRFGVCV